jgi:hypothetical protein
MTNKFKKTNIPIFGIISNFTEIFFMVTANVMWLAFSGVEPTPSHYKYNKTFHSAADFPQENPEVAIEANRCCAFVVFLYSNLCPSRSNLFLWNI